MIFIPEEIPTATSFEIRKGFDPTYLTQADKDKIQELEKIRAEFYAQLNNIPSKSIRYQTEEQLNTLKYYLFETYEFMALATTRTVLPINPSFKSVLSVKTTNFQMRENNEVSTTAEIIFSRYAYAFGVLFSIKQARDELSSCIGNKEGLSTRLEQIMFTVEDVAIRIAKLYSMRDELWVGLLETNLPYGSIPELNYQILEAFYL